MKQRILQVFILSHSASQNVEVAKCGKVQWDIRPRSHIKSYLTQVNLFSKDLGVHCRLFITTLARPFLEWYYFLPSTFIDSFNTFCTRFLARLPTTNLWSQRQHLFTMSYKGTLRHWNNI